MNEILLEYYQGKTKELIRCEGYLREIINIANSDKESGILGDNELTKRNPWNQKLEKELKDFFNVKSVNIYWKDGTMNAGTYKPCVLLIPEYKDSFSRGSTSNLKMHIVMYTDLITKAKLNEQELQTTESA